MAGTDSISVFAEGTFEEQVMNHENYLFKLLKIALTDSRVG